MYPVTTHKDLYPGTFPARPTGPKGMSEEDAYALYVASMWLGAKLSGGEPFLPPGREMPLPNEEEEEEIVPKPAVPEEEEYLPDEKEIIEHPARETDNPYEPGPTEGFPDEKEPEFPAVGPAR